MAAEWQMGAEAAYAGRAMRDAPGSTGAARNPSRTRGARIDPPTPRAALHQLATLRTIAATGQIAAVVGSVALGVSLPVVSMLLVSGIVLAMNAATWARLRAPGEPTQAAVAASLAFDLVAFTALLFLSGGASNPFSLLFVLHAVLIALFLGPRHAALGVALAVLCYAALRGLHLPLAMNGGGRVPDELLGFGHSVSLVLTSTITAWFVARIVRVLRDQARLLSESAQQALRDDAVMRVAALAAGAAHGCDTHDDGRRCQGDRASRRLAVDTARRLGAERANRDMSRDARDIDGGRGSRRRSRRRPRAPRSIPRFDRRPVPGIASRGERALRFEGARAAVEIFADQALRQALLSLLDNAVDASPRDVSFSAERQGDLLGLCIADRGPGVKAAYIDKLGRTFLTTKPPGKGVGLGLVLAARAIERLGGTVAWRNQPEQGLRVDVELPLDRLQLERQA